MLPSLRDPKARSEYPKELPAWMELDYFRRAGSLRTWRSGLSWFVLALGAGLIVFLLVGTRDRRAFQAAPVSRVHRPINEDCHTCHTRGFQTARRLWPGGASAHSVSDAACTQCHPGSVHHKRQVGETACASCHREHRGEYLLAQLNDQTCTTCHADLAARTNTSMPTDLKRPIQNVTNFTRQGHPEFALWVSGGKDEGTVRFNHRKHLKAGGIPVGERRTLTVLSCDRCHELDQSGSYMRPIEYERHCQECHPLNAGLAGDFKDERTRRDFAVFVDKPLTHPARGRTAQAVRAELRERYTEFARRHPGVLGDALAEPPPRPVPGSTRTDDVTAEKEWAWVAMQLKKAEPPLFNSNAGCLHCHRETTKPGERRDGLPTYAPPAIKERWLPHSVFKHETHRALDCEQCHAGVRESELSSAVLMPRVASCQECHKPGEQGARADCNECHLYHNPEAERAWRGTLSIEYFFKGRSPSASPPDSTH